jgi:hypothetical protein
MPVPTHEPAWWGSLIWLLGVMAAAFAIAWLSGTRLRIRRGWYVPILFTLTAGLTFGYLGWLGVGVGNVATARWGWGLLAAVIAALLLYKPMLHQPATRHVSGRQLRWELLWDDGVYGISEGVLLSALPPYITWQMVRALGWTGVVGGIARWGIPIVVATAVVIVHHLGYWNCRNKILGPISIGLSVLTVAFLVTGSWIAPALGHVFMHVEATTHGVEMPPIDRPTSSAMQEQIQPVSVA